MQKHWSAKELLSFGAQSFSNTKSTNAIIHGILSNCIFRTIFGKLFWGKMQGIVCWYSSENHLQRLFIKTFWNDFTVNCNLQQQAQNVLMVRSFLIGSIKFSLWCWLWQPSRLKVHQALRCHYQRPRVYIQFYIMSRFGYLDVIQARIFT